MDELGSLKIQIVVLTSFDYEFQKNDRFDCVMVDVQKYGNVKMKNFKIQNCSNLLYVVREEKRYNSILSTINRSHISEVVELELSESIQPKIMTIFMMVKQQSKQRTMYDLLMEDKRVNKYNTYLLDEDLRRVLLFPSMSSFGFNIKGTKLTQLEKVIKRLVENNKKIVIVSPFSPSLEYISVTYSCNYIKWESSPNENRQFSKNFTNTNELTTDKMQQFIIVVDLNSNCEGVNLSAADYLIVLDNDYQQHKIHNFCETRRLGTIKDLKIVYFVIENTIDEQDAFTQRLEEISSQRKVKLNPNTFELEFTTHVLPNMNIEKLVEINEDEFTIIRTQHEDVIDEFNKQKEEYMKKRQLEKEREEFEEKEKKSKLSRKKHDRNSINTTHQMSEIIEIDNDSDDDYSNNEMNNNKMSEENDDLTQQMTPKTRRLTRSQTNKDFEKSHTKKHFENYDWDIEDPDDFNVYKEFNNRFNENDEDDFDDIKYKSHSKKNEKKKKQKGKDKSKLESKNTSNNDHQINLFIDPTTEENENSAIHLNNNLNIQTNIDDRSKNISNKNVKTKQNPTKIPTPIIKTNFNDEDYEI